MMRRFRSLLIDQANISLPGLTVARFAVHRHLPQRAAVGPHRHRASQALLYLGGKGRQTIGEREIAVQPGTLIVMPPQVFHAFERAERRTPLCLMIDFRLKGARARPVAVCNLHRSELADVRQHLARLLQLRAAAGETFQWEASAIVLQILVNLLRTAGWLALVPASVGGRQRRGRAIHAFVLSIDPATPLSEVVRRSGYQRDHLNRLAKRETGLTVGQLRARQRLGKAREMLAQGMRVAAVGAAVGFPDQNYFARWFRKQTGETPSAWSRAARR